MDRFYRKKRVRPYAQKRIAIDPDSFSIAIVIAIALSTPGSDCRSPNHFLAIRFGDRFNPFLKILCRIIITRPPRRQHAVKRGRACVVIGRTWTLF